MLRFSIQVSGEGMNGAMSKLAGVAGIVETTTSDHFPDTREGGDHPRAARYVVIETETPAGAPKIRDEIQEALPNHSVGEFRLIRESSAQAADGPLRGHQDLGAYERPGGSWEREVVWTEGPGTNQRHLYEFTGNVSQGPGGGEPVYAFVRTLGPDEPTPRH
jgi:hypothetical protein